MTINKKIEKITYNSRESRINYLYKNYKEFLTGSILDIGCDNQYLKNILPSGQKYIGIDISGSPDITLNLEKESIPFKEKSFDTVICLDVLEHLDNLHEVFEEIIKISSKNIIISLPNCWGSFKSSFYKTLSPKFYGLPDGKPNDRHKWFFNTDDIIIFFEKMAQKNNMKINKLTFVAHGFSIKSKIISLLFKIISKKLYYNFFVNSVWVVFEK